MQIGERLRKEMGGRVGGWVGSRVETDGPECLCGWAAINLSIEGDGPECLCGWVATILSIEGRVVARVSSSPAGYFPPSDSAYRTSSS